MTFKLVVQMGNDAFADAPMTELSRILRKLADRFESGDLRDIVQDINGNTVGHLSFSQSEESPLIRVRREALEARGRFIVQCIEIAKGEPKEFHQCKDLVDRAIEYGGRQNLKREEVEAYLEETE